MKVKLTVELEMSMPNETIVKELYDKAVEDNYKNLTEEMTESFKDDGWENVNILNLVVKDVDVSKFKSNKPIK